MKEIYKDIPNYEGLYQVSNLGNVKSLERQVCGGRGYYTKEGRILKLINRSTGYSAVNLYLDKKMKSFYVHTLMAITFLNHKPDGNKLVVDHIDNNPLNNKLSNLQVITHRKNTSKDKKGGSSKYVGVRSSGANKWRSDIRINGNQKYLGSFTNELEAAKAYQEALKLIKNK